MFSADLLCHLFQTSRWTSCRPTCMFRSLLWRLGIDGSVDISSSNLILPWITGVLPSPASFLFYFSVELPCTSLTPGVDQTVVCYLCNDWSCSHPDCLSCRLSHHRSGHVLFYYAFPAIMLESCILVLRLTHSNLSLLYPSCPLSTPAGSCKLGPHFAAEI